MKRKKERKNKEISQQVKENSITDYLGETKTFIKHISRDSIFLLFLFNR